MIKDGQDNLIMLICNENANNIKVTISAILNSIINNNYILPSIMWINVKE